jgi:hypothetical protein
MTGSLTQNRVNGDPGTSHSLGRYLAEPATIAAIAHTDATSKDRETTLRTVMDQVEQKVGVIPEGMSSWNGMTDELELLEKAGKGDQSTARKE